MLRPSHKKVILSLLSVVTLSTMMSCSKCGMGADASKGTDANKSSEVSKSDYIAKVDAMCAKSKEAMKAEINALGATMKLDASDAEKTRFGAKLAEKAIESMEASFKEIEAVPAPSEGADALKKLMTDFLKAKETISEGSKVMTKMADAMDKVADSAADPATVEEGQKEIVEYSQQLKAMDMKAKQAAIKEEAMKYGFKACFQ